jgi:hypothetical protein
MEVIDTVGYVLGDNYSKCGYCESKEGSSLMFGIWFYFLSVYKYQQLVDQGW